MALLYLGLGFTLGPLMLSCTAIGFALPTLWLRPLHAESLVIGWMVQLAFGVAYWILPRLPGSRPRGSEPLAWLSLALLNVGILAVGLGQTLNVPTSVSVLGRVAEALAVCTFAIQAWPRARAYTAPGSSASRVFQAMVLLQIVRHSPSGPSHSGHCIARKRLQSAIWTGAGRSWPAPASATK